MTHFVLVASPLLGSAVWEPVALLLRRLDHRVTVAAGARPVRAPHDVADAVVAALPDEPAVLVPHSNAGLSAPLVATLGQVTATVFVDAALPPADARAVTMAPDRFAEFLAAKADADGVLPVWTQWWEEDLSPLFPDAETRERVEEQQQRLPLSYFTQPLPVPAGWHERPAAYLGFGDTYADELAFARAHGWPVSVLTGQHLEMLLRPDRVAAEIVRLHATLAVG